MVLLLEENQLYGIIKAYDQKPEELAAKTTATEMAAFKDWMNSLVLPGRLTYSACSRGYKRNTRSSMMQ
jgi:hypothetical protein